MKTFLRFTLSILHALMFMGWIWISMYVSVGEHVSKSGFGMLMCFGTLLSWFFTCIIYLDEYAELKGMVPLAALHTLVLGGMAIGAYYHVPKAISMFLISP